MRTAKLIVFAALFAVALFSGCGSDSSEEPSSPPGETSTTPSTGPAGAATRECSNKAAGLRDLRATAVDCDTAQAVAAAWDQSTSCASAKGASRSACTVHGYRCLGTVTEQGTSVSCSRPGRSLSFVATRN